MAAEGGGGIGKPQLMLIHKNTLSKDTLSKIIFRKHWLANEGVGRIRNPQLMLEKTMTGDRNKKQTTLTAVFEWELRVVTGGGIKKPRLMLRKFNSNETI